MQVNITLAFSSISNRNNSKEYELINRLKFDANGILASVLVKKGLMLNVGGIIEKYYRLTENKKTVLRGKLLKEKKYLMQ